MIPLPFASAMEKLTQGGLLMVTPPTATVGVSAANVVAGVVAVKVTGAVPVGTATVGVVVVVPPPVPVPVPGAAAVVSPPPPPPQAASVPTIKAVRPHLKSLDFI